MTRFEKEWSGQLGPYWAEQARREAARLMDQRDEILVEDDGAARWISSGNYLPEDVVVKLVYDGADFFSPEATAAKREIQIMEEIENYRKQKRELSFEERAEMSAAFGEGATVVDVLSGEEYLL